MEYIYAVTGSNTRRTTFGYYGGQKPLNRIVDPDVVSTWFYYPHEMTPAETYSPRMRQMLDRRGTRHVFSYDAAQKLSMVRLWMDSVPTAGDLIRTFGAGESRGVARENTSGTAVPVAQAYTLMDGARTDVADHTLLWLTARGAPRRIRDAMGGETVLNRGNASFPSLVTQVLGSNARGDSLVLKSSAVYDTKGRVSSTTVHDPLGAGTSAITTYGWNDAVNRPDWIQAPGVGLVSLGYDSTTRNPAWQQQGSSLRRAHFDYNAAGQVVRVRYPHPTAGYPASGGRDSLVYDAKGNLRRTVSPLGFVTLFTRDGQGRVIETRSPVHANSSSSPWPTPGCGRRWRTPSWTATPCRSPTAGR